MGTGFLSGHENVKLEVVVAGHCGCTKCHWIVLFKMATFNLKKDSKTKHFHGWFEMGMPVGTQLPWTGHKKGSM